MDAFWRHGYEATSTRDLTERTGLGASSLYHAFGDKRGLYLAALQRYYDRSTAQQLDLLRRPGPVRDRLRALMTSAIDADLPAGDTATGCFAINAAIDRGAADPEIDAQLRRHFDTVAEALRETVTRGQRAGELAADRDADTLARQIQSTYYGLRVLAPVQRDRDALLGIVDSVLAGL